MGRNEFIAETAARFAAADPSITDDVCITQATGLAHSLEARNVAPWLTPPAPALTDAARRLIAAADTAAEMIRDDAVRLGRNDVRGDWCALWVEEYDAAVRAYKESNK